MGTIEEGGCGAPNDRFVRLEKRGWKSVFVCLWLLPVVECVGVI